jgi:predicted translin family RNA/ssDNA-binding protein
MLHVLRRPLCFVGVKGKRKKLGRDHIATTRQEVTDGVTEAAAALEEAEVLVDSQTESLESWQALLAGLVEVCTGIHELVEAAVCKYVCAPCIKQMRGTC